MMIKHPRNILVVTLSNLGDVIMTLPVIAALRGAYPRAAIDVVVGEKALSLLEGNPTLNAVICYNKKGSFAEQYAFLKRLRQAHYDTVIDLRNTLIPLLLGHPFLSGILNLRARWIVSRYARYQFMVRALGLTPVAPSVVPLYTKDDNTTLMVKLHTKGLFNIQNLLVVAPGARLPLKRWPAEHFAALVNGICAVQPMTVLIVGDTFDEPVGRELAAMLSSHEAVSVCGKITQKELAVLIERARLVLSNDSAIMHLANFYERPVIGFFGPTDKDKYGLATARSRVLQKHLPCVPCRQSVCIDKSNVACLRTLMPDDVLPVALELIKNQ